MVMLICNDLVFICSVCYTLSKFSDCKKGINVALLKEDIYKAAERLTMDGNDVSVRAVREIIGKGSNTTIAEHLRDWRSTLAVRVRELNGEGNLPAPVVEASVMMLNHAREVVEAEAIAERAEALLYAEQLSIENEKLNGSITELTESNRQLQEELEEGREEIRVQVNALSLKENEVLHMNEQIEILKQANEESAKQHQDALEIEKIRYQEMEDRIVDRLSDTEAQLKQVEKSAEVRETAMRSELGRAHENLANSNESLGKMMEKLEGSDQELTKARDRIDALQQGHAKELGDLHKQFEKSTAALNKQGRAAEEKLREEIARLMSENSKKTEKLQAAQGELKE
jgi:ferritin-like metal-binding protein YciE